MDNYGYIYKTTNLIDSQIYIGQNKGRFIPSYYGSGIHLKRALDKHGRKNFKIEIICYLPNKKLLDEFEIFLISKYREIVGKEKIYNLSDGGYGYSGVKGRIISEEQKRKIGLAAIGNKNMLGKHHTEEARRKIGLASLGNKNTLGHYPNAETRKKIGLASLGNKHALNYHHTEEAKNKISLTHKGKIISEETRKRMSISAKNRCSKKGIK